MLVKELGSTPGLRIGLLGSLFVCVWRQSATVADLRFLENIQGDLVPRLGTFSMITLVSLDTAALAGPGVRERAAEMGRRFDAALTASALVLPDEGLVASIVRAFLTAHQLLFRQSAPLRVCRTLEEACQHIRNAPRQSRSLADMADMAASIRAFQKSSPPLASRSLA